MTTLGLVTTPSTELPTVVVSSTTMDTGTVTTIAPVSGLMVTTSLSGLDLRSAAVVVAVATTPTVTTVTTTALQEPVIRVATTTDLTTTTNYAIL